MSSRKLLPIIILIVLVIGTRAQAITSDGYGNEYIRPSRNLGIGTRTPSEKLEVNGNTFVAGSMTAQDGTQANGYLLTSDANGKSSWQSASALGIGSIWTDEGSYLRITNNSATKDVVIGGTDLNSAIALYANGKAFFNNGLSIYSGPHGVYPSNFLLLNGDDVDYTLKIGANGNGLTTSSLHVGYKTDETLWYGIAAAGDLTVSDDMEVDGIFYNNNFNGDLFEGSANGLVSYKGAPVGPQGAIQYRFQDTITGTPVLGANADMSFYEPSSRLGLDAHDPDTRLDVNGALSLRACVPPKIMTFIEKTTTMNGTNASSATVAAPSTSTDPTKGDILVAHIGIIYMNPAGVTVSPPAGWVQVTNQYNAINLTHVVFYKVATASETVDYGFGLDQTVDYYMTTAYLYRNGNSASVFDAHESQFTTSVINGTLISDAVNTTVDNTLILRLYTRQDDDGISMTSINVTERSSEEKENYGNPTTGIDLAASDSILMSNGNSGTGNAVYFGSTSEYATTTIALKTTDGGSCDLTLPPDNGALTAWREEAGTDPGDLNVQINNGSEVKAFKLIDFDVPQGTRTVNGATLTGLSADKLVRSDANKTLGSVATLTLEANGNIGLNNASPSSLLDVNGTTRTTAFKMPTGASNNYVMMSDANGDGTWTSSFEIFKGYVNGNHMEVQFNDNNTFAGHSSLTFNGDLLTLTDARATENGSASLPAFITNSNTGTGFSTAGDEIMISSTGVERIRLKGDGNVGIGKANPAVELEINGTTAFESYDPGALNAGDSLSPSHSYMKIASTGGDLTSTATSQLSNGVAGQIIVLKGESDTNTMTYIDGNGLQLEMNLPFKLADKHLLFMIYDPDDNEWVELGRSSR